MLSKLTLIFCATACKIHRKCAGESSSRQIFSQGFAVIQGLECVIERPEGRGEREESEFPAAPLGFSDENRISFWCVYNYLLKTWENILLLCEGVS